MLNKSMKLSAPALTGQCRLCRLTRLLSSVIICRLRCTASCETPVERCRALFTSGRLCRSRLQMRPVSTCYATLVKIDSRDAANRGFLNIASAEDVSAYTTS